MSETELRLILLTPDGGEIRVVHTSDHVWRVAASEAKPFAEGGRVAAAAFNTEAEAVKFAEDVWEWAIGGAS